MRSTTIGADQDLAFRNVPAASNATVLTPSTTATVMLIISNGECFKEGRMRMTKSPNFYNTALTLNISFFYISFLNKEQGQNIIFVTPPATC